jgi:transposase
MAGYQLSAFEIGQIKAHVYHGLGAAQIARILVKADGKTHWSDNAVQTQIDKLDEKPNWRGERREGSMRPRKTSAKQDAQIVALLRRLRGKKKVTVAVLRKFIVWTRPLSDSLLEERLHDAGRTPRLSSLQRRVGNTLSRSGSGVFQWL